MITLPCAYSRWQPAASLLYNELYNQQECVVESISYSDARNNLARMMDKVCDDHAAITITRKNARSVVIMSLEDFEALEETAYLLRSPENARRLIESISELEAGGGQARKLVD